MRPRSPRDLEVESPNGNGKRTYPQMSDNFNSGTRVRVATDPGRVGVCTGRVRERAGVSYLQVQFPDSAQFVPRDHLELVAAEGDDPLDLLQRGRLARPVDLRRTVTHARLTGRLANVIYSMDATGADFYAYQFKPLVKLLNSATTGMLIADEVGLGKTIEAGLIWTELRSRFEYDRLLVLCPAMLREKWRRELRQRFGVDAAVVDASELLRHLRRAVEEPHATQFALIASLQGVRPRRGWDQAETGTEGGPASELARFLDEHASDRPLVDLTVIDEAHYLRNPDTMTADIGRLVRGVTEYLVMLSATPVHLRSGDLYQVLNLADPATFDRPEAFDDLLAANAPLVRARDLVASGRGTAEALLSLLREAAVNPLLQGSRQLEMLLAEVPTDHALRDPRAAGEFAARLETVNLLGHVVTRTRKRDVKEWRVVREPVPEAVTLSAVEREFYEAVTGVVRDYCARYMAHEGFLLVMPQRQMSSSMPAAFRSWMQRNAPADEDAYEEFGEEDSMESSLGPLVGALVERVGSLSSFEVLRGNDSKYQRLRECLLRLFESHAKEKVVLFSSFKPTLAYLQERLREDGIDTLILHGGTENKDAVVMEFRRSDGGIVLLSSEVASEGVDLQFAWVVINYDLPWNPMRVEQRIGRLDRLGQESPKVAIWNLFYDATIDARIYRRLYERLRVFEGALGSLEPILGGEVRRLALDLFQQKLTPAEEEARIEQTRLALANQCLQEEHLEAEAAHLVAYGDYIVDQIHAARELQRRIDGADLRSYVIDFFSSHYPGCEFRQLGTGLDYEVTLSAEAKDDLERFLREHRASVLTRLAVVEARGVHCRFENQVAGGRLGRTEIINQLHPLVRFTSERQQKAESELIRPAVAARIAAGDISTPIRPDVYGFAVERWSMQGIQRLEYLAYTATSLADPSSALSPEDAERLVHAASTAGADWLSADAEVDLRRAYDVVNECCLVSSRQAYERKVTELRAQNDDRAQIQQRTVTAHFEMQKRNLDQVLERHRSLGRSALVRATEGKLRALSERRDRKMREIEQRRRFVHTAEEICVGVVRVEADGVNRPTTAG